jgi:hypothetical protein
LRDAVIYLCSDVLLLELHLIGTYFHRFVDFYLFSFKNQIVKLHVTLIGKRIMKQAQCSICVNATQVYVTTVVSNMCLLIID